MKNQKINQKVSPGTNNQKQKNYYIIDNLLVRLMKREQETQNVLTLSPSKPWAASPMTAWVEILSSSPLLLKKRGGNKVKAITKAPCVAKQLPICLVDANPFFSKQRSSE